MDGRDGVDGQDGHDGEDLTSIDQLNILKIGSFDNGAGEAFAEIYAFDPVTNKLFIINPEEDEVSVLDLTDATNPVKGSSISLSRSPGHLSL